MSRNRELPPSTGVIPRFYGPVAIKQRCYLSILAWLCHHGLGRYVEFFGDQLLAPADIIQTFHPER